MLELDEASTDRISARAPLPSELARTLSLRLEGLHRVSCGLFGPGNRASTGAEAPREPQASGGAAACAAAPFLSSTVAYGIVTEFP